MSAIPGVSETFDPDAWQEVPGFEDLTDVTYHRAVGLGCVRVAFDRPEVLNAFRPHTVDELYRVLDHARRTADVGVDALRPELAPGLEQRGLPGGIGKHTLAGAALLDPLG